MDSDWPRFWTEKRLLAGATDVSSALTRRLEASCKTLPERLPADPGAVLLHGDLWIGNVVAHDGQVQGLMDPACYYGHSEVDLAMLSLFGCPDENFWKSYGVSPEPDLEDRRAIYQLWLALVHLRLFGDSYRGVVERRLDRCSVGTEVRETTKGANLYLADLITQLVPLRFLNIENKQFCSCY